MNQPDTWHRACPNAATCVEVGYVGPGSVTSGMIVVRDSKMGEHSPILEFTPDEWDVFITGVKAGEFDWTTDPEGDPVIPDERPDVYALQKRITELEAELQDAREANEAMREAVQKSRGERCHRSYPHPAHGWMFARRAMRCPGVTDNPKEPTP